MTPTVVFDFDGVIHSYCSGWKGKTVILTRRVQDREAINNIRKLYRVVVVSTRCDTTDGIMVVKEYLAKYDIVVDDVMKEKPPAIVYIDDRAICFDGNPHGLLDKITAFEPWTAKAMRRNEE